MKLSNNETLGLSIFAVSMICLLVAPNVYADGGPDLDKMQGTPNYPSLEEIEKTAKAERDAYARKHGEMTDQDREELSKSIERATGRKVGE